MRYFLQWEYVPFNDLSKNLVEFLLTLIGTNFINISIFKINTEQNWLLYCQNKLNTIQKPLQDCTKEFSAIVNKLWRISSVPYIYTKQNIAFTSSNGQQYTVGPDQTIELNTRDQIIASGVCPQQSLIITPPE